MGIWASPAWAGIKCSSYTVRQCNGGLCCYTTCVYCFDTETGDVVSESCSDPDCYEIAP